MIKSFRHKGLEDFFLRGTMKGIKAEHAKKLRQILAILNVASSLDDIKSAKSLGFHPLSGQRKHEYAVWVNKNWRVTFEFKDGDVYLTNYEDYH